MKPKDGNLVDDLNDPAACETFRGRLEGHSGPNQCQPTLEMTLVCLESMPLCTEIEVENDGCATFNDPAAEAQIQNLYGDLEPGVCVVLKGQQCLGSTNLCATTTIFSLTSEGCDITLPDCPEQNEPCYRADPGLPPELNRQECLIDGPNDTKTQTQYYCCPSATPSGPLNGEWKPGATEEEACK